MVLCDVDVIVEHHPPDWLGAGWVGDGPIIESVLVPEENVVEQVADPHDHAVEVHKLLVTLLEALGGAENVLE